MSILPDDYEMVIGQPLEGVTDPKDRRLVEGLADQLESDGHTVRQPARHREPRQPREIDRRRIDVRQVHRERVVALFTESERRLWHGRRHDQIARREGLLEIPTDQRSDALGLACLLYTSPSPRD